MKKRNRKINFFNIYPKGEVAQFGLNIFSEIKDKKVFSVNHTKGKSVSGSIDRDDLINVYRERELIKSSAGSLGIDFGFNDSGGKVLGIGIKDETCFLTVMDICGNIIAKEHVGIKPLHDIKGKVREIKEIRERIQNGTKLRGSKFLCVGLALPEILEKRNVKSADILASGIGEVFKSDVFMCAEATAAGYGEKDFGTVPGKRDIIYVHSDVGEGVVIKGEMIFEAEINDNEGRSYLRPWDQFSLVSTAKYLVNKGVGTRIVEIVNGDVEGITLDVVLDAAEKKDAVAVDMVRRSALALGVRIAYLVNMFNTPSVIMGGGVERQVAGFMDYAKESADKFVSKNMEGGLKLVPGVLGKESSSIGAAALCRRELFMEV